MCSWMSFRQEEAVALLGHLIQIVSESNDPAGPHLPGASCLKKSLAYPDSGSYDLTDPQLLHASPLKKSVTFKYPLSETNLALHKLPQTPMKVAGSAHAGNWNRGDLSMSGTDSPNRYTPTKYDRSVISFL
jgi:hypothetical protein